MDTINNYVDSVFANLPKTPEMSDQKQAMLTKMQDKYQQLKSEGKSEHEAISAAIAAHGNVDDFTVSDIPAAPAEIPKMKSTLLPNKSTNTSIIAIISPGRWRQVFSCASWAQPACFSVSTLPATEMVREAVRVN